MEKTCIVKRLKSDVSATDSNTWRKGISLIPIISSTAVFGRKVLVTKYSFRYLSHYDFRNIHTAFIMVSAITDM